MQGHRNLPLVGLLIVLVFAFAQPSAAAQGTVQWTEPLNISDSQTTSTHPAIVADAYGYVHVFWCEDVNGREVAPDEVGDPPNTILYRRWDGQAWTEPVDILAVPGDALADYVAATVDNENRLHLVWTGLVNLYHSSAPANLAGSARAWSTPEVIATDSARSGYESDVAVDSQGNVHIVYAAGGSGAGVFHTMTASAGGAWTTPVRISDYLRSNEVAFAHVRLAADGAGRLHAAWSTSNLNGYGQAVYYARSDELGSAWEPAVLLADALTNTGFVGFPNLLAVGRDDLILIYVGEQARGRIERTSTDGGKTWSEGRPILDSMTGVNGFMIPLQDGAGSLHLIVNMRPVADQRTGIYYAPRSGFDWAPIIPVAVDEPYGPDAHYADATIRLGNEIHVVWKQHHGAEIWYARGMVYGVSPAAAQAVPAMSLPTAIPPRPRREAPTPYREPTASPPAVTGRTPAEVPAVPTWYSSTWVALAAAVAPVLLLLAGTVLWQVRKR